MLEGQPVPTTRAELRASPFRVGDWVAEPDWNRIRRDGEIVKLEPRVMRLLSTLAAAPNRPLSRQELLDTVWPDTVVNEEALSRAVSQLRRALGDDRKAPRYLQTVHKGGYCLIAPVSDAAMEPPPAAPPRPPRGSRHFLRFFLLLLVVSGAGAILYFAQGPDAQTPALRPLIPLTSDPGREIDPAISPDGRRVAYLASSRTGYQLFVRSIDGGKTARLTDSASAKGHIAWSPGSDRLAFVAADRGAAAIHLLSLKTGKAEKLVDLPSWSFGLDWSPDGRMLAYSDAAPGEAPGIVLLDIVTRSARPIARSASSAGDVKPVFSPDGKRLAFIRTDQQERGRIAVVDLASGGEAELLAVPAQQLRGLDWAPGGESLIFSAKTGRRFGLWRAAASGGLPEPLSIEGGDLFNPSVSPQGRIIVEEVEQDRDIRRIDLETGRSASLIGSTADDADPSYAPDGREIAFVSERSGASEIWIQSAVGDARRATRLSGPELGHLAWTADSRRLAFVAEDNGTSSIYAIGAAGGDPIRLTDGVAGQIPIGWTPRADAIFLLLPASGHWTAEEFSLSDRTRRALALPILRVATVSVDGGSIFAVPAGESKLLHFVRGQGVVRQFRLPPLPGLTALLASAEAIYLVEDGFGSARIHKIDLKSGAFRTVIDLDHFGGGALSLLRGRPALAYTTARETANDLAWIQL